MRGPYRVMGIVNVTPDSFSDGGLFLDADAAVEHGLRLVQEGAHILDIGGESTRPGAEPVGLEEELRRVVPVVEGLAERCGVQHAEGSLGEQYAGERSLGERLAPGQRAGGTAPQISIDTSKAVVARAALRAGASLVNDVTALRGDPKMVEIVAHSGAGCCLMHMLGEPRTMQTHPRYGDVVDEVKAFLNERLRFAVGRGIPEERILLDPGIGFGKTVEHNLALLRRLDEIVALGRPVVIGTSRKSFLGRIAAGARAQRAAPVAQSIDGGVPGPDGEASHTPEVSDTPTKRLPGTIATNVLALERGASVFRVHDVAAVADALAVASATLTGRWTTSRPRSATKRTG